MDVQGSGSKMRCLHPSLSFSSSSSDSKHKQLENSRSFDPGSGAIGECHEARDPDSGGSLGASLAVPATKVSRSTSPFSFYRSRSWDETYFKTFLSLYCILIQVDSALWFRSGKKKIEKQKKIPDEFICPTSPLSISPGPYDSCARKVLIKVSVFCTKKCVDILKSTSSVDEWNEKIFWLWWTFQRTCHFNIKR